MEYISNKVESSESGRSLVEEVASHIQKTEPGIKGFSKQLKKYDKMKILTPKKESNEMMK